MNHDPALSNSSHTKLNGGMIGFCTTSSTGFVHIYQLVQDKVIILLSAIQDRRNFLAAWHQIFGSTLYYRAARKEGTRLCLGTLASPSKAVSKSATEFGRPGQKCVWRRRRMMGGEMTPEMAHNVIKSGAQWTDGVVNSQSSPPPPPPPLALAP